MWNVEGTVGAVWVRWCSAVDRRTCEASLGREPLGRAQASDIFLGSVGFLSQPWSRRFSLPDGALTTYDSYPERTLPDGRVSATLDPL